MSLICSVLVDFGNTPINKKESRESISENIKWRNLYFKKTYIYILVMSN